MGEGGKMGAEAEVGLGVGVGVLVLVKAVFLACIAGAHWELREEARSWDLAAAAEASLPPPRSPSKSTPVPCTNIRRDRGLSILSEAPATPGLLRARERFGSVKCSEGKVDLRL